VLPTETTQSPIATAVAPTIALPTEAPTSVTVEPLPTLVPATPIAIGMPSTGSGGDSSAGLLAWLALAGGLLLGGIAALSAVKVRR
jgi:hypothetical protein